MLQHKVPLSSKKEYSIPGKVFLLGEYAVLAGLPALIAAVPQRFTWELKSLGQASDEICHPVYHPESPLGRLNAWAREMGFVSDSVHFPFHFKDPFQGAGGFGASTAQFAMGYLAYLEGAGQSLKEVTWLQVWMLYRELMRGASDSGLTPSGADLVAQWQGGVSWFDPTRRTCENVAAQFEGSHLLIFSATGQVGRKVPTHEHLERLSHVDLLGLRSESGDWISLLKQSLEEGISALRSHDFQSFGRVMNRYADQLRSVGLEVSATYEDRKVLSELPDVWGVKGAGALQSDAVIILMKAGSAHRNHVIETAQGRGLVLVSDGLHEQMGVQCHSE